MFISVLVLLSFTICVLGVVPNAPYSDYCLGTNIEMSPDHYCASSVGCQPDPPGAASMALDPADAAYPVAWLAWPAAPFPWGFAQTCFKLTGSKDGPWPYSYNLGNEVLVQLYDWAPHASPHMGIMYDPYVSVCNRTWNNSAVPPGWSTCNVWAQMVECPAQSRLNSGNIIFDFNQWNNGYTVLVQFRNSRLGVETVILTDALNTTGITLTRDNGVAFILGNRQVNLPFTLQLIALNGETHSFEITDGFPNAGAWGTSNFGTTYSVNSNIQFTTNYECASIPTTPFDTTTGAPTNSGSTSSPYFLMPILTLSILFFFSFFN